MRQVVLTGALSLGNPAEDLVEWVRVGDLLRQCEPERFARLLALGQSYASAHDEELEPRAVFEARLCFVTGKKSRDSLS